MAQENKIEGTINKLIEKYSTVKDSWAHSLVPMLQHKSFKTLMEFLMGLLDKGVSFTPGFKSIFQRFDDADLNNVKVIVIYSGEETLHNFKTDEVLELRVPFTSDSTRSDAHSFLWKNCIQVLIDSIIYSKIKKVFVFVGKDVENMGPTKSKSHSCYYIPSDISEEELEAVKFSINVVLENNKFDMLDW